MCEITHDDHDGSPYKLMNLGASSSKSWFKVEHVDKVQRSSSAGYIVGEKVHMRDGIDWKTGHAMIVSPLKVAFEHETRGSGYSWNEVPSADAVARLYLFRRRAGP